MIEINRKDSEYIFRIDPDDPCMIDRRKNVHRGRWQWYARRATPEETRKYLLELESEQKVVTK